MAKPVVKWVGGKTKLLPEIKKRIPGSYGKYIEPFFGGGALYFDIQPENAVIGDINPQLVWTYWNIKENPDKVMNALDILQHSFNSLPGQNEKQKFYEKQRKVFNCAIQNGDTSPDEAALFIFLNKTCFNGVYRVNRKGLFNVPFAKKTSVSLYDRDNLLKVHKALPDSIICGSFESTILQADPKKGDFVFIDSPYVDTYAGYGKDRFSMEDHIKLRDLFAEMADMGVYCMATNSCCDEVKDLYRGFIIEEASVSHPVNRDGNGRKAKEVIIRNYT